MAVIVLVVVLMVLTPKSATLQTHLLLTRRFWGLRSRWMSFFEWRYCLEKHVRVVDNTCSGGAALTCPWQRHAIAWSELSKRDSAPF